MVVAENEAGEARTGATLHVEKSWSTESSSLPRTARLPTTSPIPPPVPKHFSQTREEAEFVQKEFSEIG